MIRITSFTLFLGLSLGILSCDTGNAAPKKKKLRFDTPPDLTKKIITDDTRDWQLGPAGMNGWVFNKNTRNGGSREARQILVTRVEKNGPADGKIKVNDIILGVNGKPFTMDARKAFANAINEAEEKANKGKLKLIVWRDGKKSEVVLQLEVMGSYSDTAPYNCPKTELVIKNAIKYLKDKDLKAEWIGYNTALGLLSTGDKTLMPKLKKFARKICIPGEVINVEDHVSMLSWKVSYKCLFLCEYYLATKDKYVLPTIKEYATKIAMGQSGVGSWGHCFAARANTGSLHGYLGGYGAINQQGLTLMLCLVLAEKCGVKNEEITEAIKRGTIYFGFYSGKGAIPYGDHRPNKIWFDDNGKSGAAAIFFDILNDDNVADFFTSMVIASTPAGREAGHTGCYWSHLWGGIGAAQGGKNALIAFFKEMNWAFTLERDNTGRMAFQDNVGEFGNKGEAKEKWDCTGTRLLQLCAPRKKLYITGRGRSLQPPLSQEKIEDLIAIGRLVGNSEALEKLSEKEIFKLLAHELPAARSLAVSAMSKQNIQCVSDLLRLLKSKDKYARYGACEALRACGYNSKRAVDALVDRIEKDDDLYLRLNAIDALTGRDLKKGLAPAAKAAIPALLELAVTSSKDDPRRLLQRKLGFALFYSGNALDIKGLIVLHGLDHVSRKLLIPAVKELLTVDDGRSRSCVGWVYDKLSESELKQLWGDIYIATRDLSPSGIMFADGIRIKGLKLMQKNSVEEGVDLCISIISEERWGRGKREIAIFPIFADYGPDAKRALPNVKAIKAKDNVLKEKAIKAMEEGKPKTLKSIKPYLKNNK